MFRVKADKSFHDFFLSFDDFFLFHDIPNISPPYYVLHTMSYLTYDLHTMSLFSFCLGGREADGRASDAGTWRQRWRSVADEGDGSDAEEDACHAALPGPPPTARKGRDTIHAQQVECLCTYTPTDRHTHIPHTLVTG